MERHRPVMAEEVVELLVPEGTGLVIDCTLGMGGHTERLLERYPDLQVLGLDRDAESIELARQRLARFGERFEAVHTDYREIGTVVPAGRWGAGSPVRGILVDLGISSYQLDTPERGFSFRSRQVAAPVRSALPGGTGEPGVTGEPGGTGEPGDEKFEPGVAPEEREARSGADSPLDMRMDRTSGLTAADLVNRLSERELADLIFNYGEERASRRIARLIVAERGAAPIRTTAQLAALVVRAVNQQGYWKTHPATKTFQALRIAVNRELEGLDSFVEEAVNLLAPEGRLVVITFHSLEDRSIKQAFRRQAGQCQCPPTRPRCECGAERRVEILTRKALSPQPAEVELNPRSRSARLRACRRMPERRDEVS